MHTGNSSVCGLQWHCLEDRHLHESCTKMQKWCPKGPKTPNYINGIVVSGSRLPNLGAMGSNPVGRTNFCLPSNAGRSHPRPWLSSHKLGRPVGLANPFGFGGLRFEPVRVRWSEVRTHSGSVARASSEQPHDARHRSRAKCATSAIDVKSLVGERGFEPPAPASRRQCSTRLSYSPTGSPPVSRRRGRARVYGLNVGVASAQSRRIGPALSLADAPG